MKEREKKQRTAGDRWWERWTHRWRKYKAQYWFLVSSGVRQDAHCCPHAPLSPGLNISFFCPSLISSTNGVWCKPGPCLFRLNVVHLFILKCIYLFVHRGFCYYRMGIHQLDSDFPKNPLLSNRKCLFYDNKPKELCGFMTRAFPLSCRIISWLFKP